EAEDDFGNDKADVQQDADRERLAEVRRRVIVAMSMYRHRICALIALADNARRRFRYKMKEAVREGDPDRLYCSASGERQSALWSLKFVKDRCLRRCPRAWGGVPSNTH